MTEKRNYANPDPSSTYLKELIKMNKENLEMTKEEFNLLRRFQTGAAEKTASILSEKLGAEEAFTREISHDISTMFSKNEEMRTTYEKADKDDKELMLDQIKQEVINRYKLDKKFFEKNEDFINNAMVNVDGSMDKIVSNGSKMLYPLISNMIRTIDDFRHTISDKFPKTVGRFLSDEMVEHYKTGAKEIGQHFQQHMSTILEPISAITGPIIAVSKSLFTIGKTLFSGPTKYEKETSKVQREIRDTLKGQRRDNKKTWLADKKERLKNLQMNIKEKGKDFWSFIKKMVIPAFALGVGILVGYFEQVRTILGPIISSFRSIGTKFVKVSDFFKKIFGKINKFGSKIITFLTKGPMGKLFFTVGKVVGKMYMPLKMVWNFFKDFGKIKDMFAAGDIVGILKTISSDILQPILELPEMFINALSWIFDSEFRVDFGKEAIVGMIDDVTEWVFENITVPVMDFFTKTIPDFFNEVFGFIGKIKDYISELKDSIFGGVAKFFGFGGDEPEDDENKNKKMTDKSVRQKRFDETGFYKTDKELFKEYKTGILNGTIADPAKGGTSFDVFKSMRQTLNFELSDETQAELDRKEKARKEKQFNKDHPLSPSSSRLLTEKEKAKANQNNKQLNATKDLSDKIDKNNRNVNENNNVNQQNFNISGDNNSDIPTEPENMGIMLFSKTWGLS